MRKINYIIIHHSATGVENTAGIINAIFNHWNVHPYHFYIGAKGEVINWLGIWQIGGHTMNATYNANSIAICLLGNFENHKPTQSQTDSLIKLIKELKKEYWDLQIIGHKNTPNNNTLCPWKYLGLEEIRQRTEIKKNFYQVIFENEFGKSSYLKDIDLAKENCINQDGTLNEHFFRLMLILLERRK